MNKPSFLIFLLILSGLSVLHGQSVVYSEGSGEQGTLEKQILYNGRVWRNLYSRVDGYPFLIVSQFLPGTVTIGGKTFDNIMIRYDIYKDQIQILTDKVIILQLNKELVDGFTIQFAEMTYNFRKFEEDDLSPVSGYVNIAYNGASSLFVKYKKEIDVSGSDNLFGTFYQLQRIYLIKDSTTHLVNSRNDFLRLLRDRKQEVRNFIKENKIKVSKLNPFTFATVLKYYDAIK